MSEPMADVTDRTITLEVSLGQYAQLEQDREYPGRPRVTHKVSVGPFSVPGNWVVVSTLKGDYNGTRCYVTLARLED